MRRVLLLTLLLLASLSIPAEAKRRAVSSQTAAYSETEREVLRDFERILDLWRDGRYDDLFERTFTGRESKEVFGKRMAAAPRKPACCWEKMQDARVSLKGDGAAVVRARLGFEGSVPGTQFVTKGIKLQKEGGYWMITQSDLFSLADITKKKHLYKYIPTQK